MDPLSDVLRVLKPGRYAAAAFDFGVNWSVEFPPHDGIKCYALLSGQGWLKMDGVAEPVWATAGDCVLLPHGRSFLVASDLALAPVNSEALYAMSPQSTTSTQDGGGHTRGFAAHFELSGPLADFLLGNLPPIMHIRKDAQKARLRWCLEQMMLELTEPEPGSAVVLQQLAGMVLVQAIRVHLASASPHGTGWLYALADSKMADAIQAMHDDPVRRWTLQSLAKHVGMSRAAFSLKFKSTVGQSPMDYLTRWRMLLAADRLSTTPAPVSAVANALGYESDSAFGSAFKRVMGHSPREWARRREAQQAAGA